MAVDVLLIPLIAAAACALPIGTLARPLAVTAGILTAATAFAASYLGIGAAAAEMLVWAGPLGARFAVGADGFAAALLMLTGVGFAVGAAASASVRSPRGYFAAWLSLQAACAGVLVARDLLLFFAFWQALLVPLGLLTWLWGGADRRAAGRHLVFSWLAADAFLLTGIVALGVGARTFGLADLAVYRLSESSQAIFAALFLVAFAMRLPLFPLHGWIRPAYSAAPLPVALVLSSVVSKLAIYGIVRICVVLFPRGMADLEPVTVALAAVGVLYGGLLATRQRDTRGLIAYASVSQLDLAALGALFVTVSGTDGALLLSLSHGLAVAAFFLLAAALARRNRSFAAVAVGARAPVLTSFLALTVFALIGVPGTSGAPGELLVVAAAFAQSPAIGFLAAFGGLIAAWYGVGLLRATSLDGGDPVSPDLGWGERALVIPLLALVLIVGVAPRLITDLSAQAVDPAATVR